MDFLKELFNSSKIKVALENNRLRAELDKQKYLHFEKRAEEYADKWRSSKKDLALANEKLRKLKKEGKYGRKIKHSNV